MRNGSDEEYDVNFVVDGGPDEWHVIVDTEFEEEITVSAATMHRPDHLFSPQDHNSRILQGALSVHAQIRWKNRKRMDWLVVT